MRGGKTAKTDIRRQLRANIENLCIALLECQIFGKGKRKDAKRNIAPRQICGDFRRHHAGIGACHIDIDIAFCGKGIDDALPAFDLLNFIKEAVCLADGTKPGFRGGEHLPRRHHFVLHRIKTHADDVL